MRPSNSVVGRARVVLSCSVCSWYLAAGCAPVDETAEADKHGNWFLGGDFAISFGYTHEEMLRFDVPRFLGDNGTHLQPYAEVITHVAAEERISPRLLIALMEQMSGAVGDPFFDGDRPLGDLSEQVGFLEQLRDVCGFFRAAPSPREGIAVLMTEADRAHLGDVYQRLFPNAEDGRNAPVTGAQGGPPAMQLPYPIGVRWFFGGTHGRNMGSLDFMDRGEDWGDTTSDPVVAAAGGEAVRHSSCSVSVLHDNNWSTSYYHLDNVVIRTGEIVDANDPLAHYADSYNQALCEGGSSTGPHVHFSLYDGDSKSTLDRRVLSGWTIHAGDYDYDDDCDRMYLSRDGEKKCPWKLLRNEGIDGQLPQTCDGQCSSSCRCDAGQGDCDNDQECAEGLYCEQQEGTDYCREQTSCDGRCSTSCPCAEGEGDCDTDGECIDGLYCEQQSGTDYCREQTSCDGRCSTSCPCAEGEGDCDTDGECTDGLYCEQQTGTDYCREQTSCNGRCSTSCPCAEGQGDCDTDGECTDGLYCEQQTGTDYCREQTSCNGRCSTSCPCAEGQGDCDTDGECTDGLYCEQQSGTDYCREQTSCNGRCSTSCPCAEGQGDCDTDGECTDGLYCEQQSGTDYCRAQASCDGRCSSSCPCAEGEGDCDTDAECTDGLYCEQQSGTDYCQRETVTSEPRIELSKDRYSVSEPIVVRFRDLPGNATDWVGTYRSGSAHSEYIRWRYTSGAVEGTIRLPGLTEPGDYEVRLFFNDGYTLEQSVSLTVE